MSLTKVNLQESKIRSRPTTWSNYLDLYQIFIYKNLNTQFKITYRVTKFYRNQVIGGEALQTPLINTKRTRQRDQEREVQQSRVIGSQRRRNRSAIGSRRWRKAHGSAIGSQRKRWRQRERKPEVAQPIVIGSRRQTIRGTIESRGRSNLGAIGSQMEARRRRDQEPKAKQSKMRIAVCSKKKNRERVRERVTE